MSNKYKVSIFSRTVDYSTISQVIVIQVKLKDGYQPHRRPRAMLCQDQYTKYRYVKNKYQPDQIKLQQVEAELGQAQV